MDNENDLRKDYESMNDSEKDEFVDWLIDNYYRYKELQKAVDGLWNYKNRIDSY